MKRSLKLVCFLLLVVSIVNCNFLPVSATYLNYPGVVSISFDKQDANVGEIITASVNIANAPEFAAMQFNLKYDPTVLQAVDPATGQPYPDIINGFFPNVFSNQLESDILLNNTYLPYEYGDFDSVDGTVNGTRGYLLINDYMQGGIADTQGTVARIGFKVLKHETTSVYFEDCDTMPGAISGTLIATWDGEMQSGYVVNQPGSIM